MPKIIVVAVILCVGIQAASLPKNDTATIFVSDLATYLSENPELKVIAELERNENNKIPIRYTVGKRVSGDRLVSELSGRKSWSQPQDIVFTIIYPTSGVGAVITYVQIDVNDQSNDLGRGVIVAGGVGQRNIQLVVEAKSTMFFEHRAAIFGVD